jgi:hypothetical protein
MTRVVLSSPQPGAFAALAFHDLVALLEQTLALAVLAFLLLLGVRAFFVRHRVLLNPAISLARRAIGRATSGFDSSADLAILNIAPAVAT